MNRKVVGLYYLLRLTIEYDGIFKDHNVVTDWRLLKNNSNIIIGQYESFIIVNYKMVKIITMNTPEHHPQRHLRFTKGPEFNRFDAVYDEIYNACYKHNFTQNCLKMTRKNS